MEDFYTFLIHPWRLGIIVYLFLATITFIPVLLAQMNKIELHPGGESFEESNSFSEDMKLKLKQNYSRIYGTLIFWKNKAEWYRRFHYYTICWTIPVSLLIPIIAQSIDQHVESKLFLTIISSHTAILIAFHRALKVENNFKAFRHGESEFYDLYRRLLDRPNTFGKSQGEQIENYFYEVEKIRKNVRIAETDNFPIIDDHKREE